MSTSSVPELTSGRLFVLFQAQLRIDSHALGAWTSHREGGDWDHVVEHCMQGAVDSQAARMQRAGLPVPTVAWRHVVGGVAECTAAASQLLGKDARHRVLIAYIGGEGQAGDLAELATALAPAVTADHVLTLFVGNWGQAPGHSLRWEKVFSAHVLRGPDAEAGDVRGPHPVLDGLRPELPDLG